MLSLIKKECPGASLITPEQTFQIGQLGWLNSHDVAAGTTGGVGSFADLEAGLLHFAGEVQRHILVVPGFLIPPVGPPPAHLLPTG